VIRETSRRRIRIASEALAQFFFTQFNVRERGTQGYITEKISSYVRALFIRSFKENITEEQKRVSRYALKHVLFDQLKI